MQRDLFCADDMSKILSRMTYQIAEKCDLNNICIVGIHKRGVNIAQRLKDLFKKYHNVDVDLGSVDITLYRDDLSEISSFPQVYGTDLSCDINGKTVLLVDDVLYTGRTVKAAIECISAFGRPEKIMLLVFIDRGHRELPIQADFVGKFIPSRKDEIVSVHILEVDGEDKITIEERAI